MTGFVVWNTIPRLINSAGDPQFNVDWHLNDRIVDTDTDNTTQTKNYQMVSRNWTTPYQVRETIYQRRYEKPCSRSPEGNGGYILPGYDTCVIRYSQESIDK